jgi:hypothetical protein
MLTAFALAAAMTLNEPCGSMAFFDHMDKVTLYRVKAPGRTRFLSNYAPDGGDCSDDKPCAIKAYLVTGDVVAVSHQRKGYACAWFKPSPKHLPRGKRKIDPLRIEGPSTQAWLPLSALEPAEVPAGRPAAIWNGEWVGESQLLDITPKGEGRLTIKGVAYYARDAEAVEMGGVNVGEIDGLYFRDGDRAEGAVADDESIRRPTPADDRDDAYRCVLRLRLVGGYLLAKDNNRCGGMNVSFTGVYRRDPAL